MPLTSSSENYRFLEEYDMSNSSYQVMLLPVEIEIVDHLQDPDIIATVNYPDGGNVIQIVKGLNKLQFETAIIHELCHLFDWYLESQSSDQTVRENIACALSLDISKAAKTGEYAQ